MKETQKIIVATVVAIFMLSGLILIPFTHAMQNQTISPTEQVRTRIEAGFSDYVQTKHLQLSIVESPETVFSEFLHANPIYQEYLGEYTNLTKLDINNTLPVGPPNATAAKMESPFKTVNQTVNGKTYQVCYTLGKSVDGQDFIKVTMGGTGTDPWIYVEIIALTITILGIPINYGEDEYFAEYFTAGDEANAFMSNFDSISSGLSNLSDLVWSVFSSAIDIFAAEESGPIIDILGNLINADKDYYIERVDQANDSTYGISLCAENKIIGTLFISPFVLPDFAIYVKHWSDDNGLWIKDYPHYYPYWVYVVLDPMSAEINADSLESVITLFALAEGTNQWVWIPDPASPSEHPTPGPGRLLFPTIVGYDDSYENRYDDQSNSVNPNVQVDGFDIGSVSSLRIIPEIHNFVFDKYIPTSEGYGYTFSYMTIEGNNYYDNEAQVELSTNSTIEVHYTYGPLVFTVSVNAFNAWIGYNFPIESNVYIDDVWAGTTPDDFQLSYGWHSISTDEYVWDPWINAWDISYLIGPYDQYGTYMIEGHYYYFFVDDDVEIGAAYTQAP